MGDRKRSRPQTQTPSFGERCVGTWGALSRSTAELLLLRSLAPDIGRGASSKASFGLASLQIAGPL